MPDERKARKVIRRLAIAVGLLFLAAALEALTIMHLSAVISDQEKLIRVYREKNADVGAGTDSEPSPSPTPDSPQTPEASQASESSASFISQGEAAEGRPDEDELSRKIAAMSLEEKAAQLFFITPDALVKASGVREYDERISAAYGRCPVGGFIFFENNIEDKEQLQQLTRALAGLGMERIGITPFIAADEEGGRVERLAGRIGAEPVGSMADLGSDGEAEKAYSAGAYIGSYLKECGFNVDFAPVADVLTNPDNAVIGDRSFGSDPLLVGKMAAEEVRGLSEAGISAALKHFPGHGSTSEDSHKGAAVSYRTIEELRECDLLPFQEGIAAGADFVMAGHISFPNILEDYSPATLSSYFLKDLLRRKLGFEGIVITDALNMGAVTQLYDSDEAAVRALLAGADMILMPADFQSAYAGVLRAVSSGQLTEERIDESLERILKVKLARGLL
ncbi:MAG: glycoside hydrolase family 3 protein [Lachnospiraceae bacterium]|nr:glycoside hydrolase family 3 protein [Lachnospiraceae bacterium]